MFSLVPLVTLVASALTASAGTFISPAAGSTISQYPFNFTWQSSRYFKESSISVSVLLSPNFEGTYDSIELAHDLAPVEGVGAPNPHYTAELTPEFFYEDPGKGTYQLLVFEKYTAYGGSTAVSIEWENVTFGS